MKKVLLLVPLMLLMGFWGCKKVNDLLTFDTTVTADATFVPVTGAQLPAVSVTTRSEETFQNNNTHRDKVKNVLLKKLLLTVKDPAGGNFNFVGKVKIYISTNSSNQILLAHHDNVPRNVTTLELEPTKAKLDEYLKSPTYSLLSEVTPPTGELGTGMRYTVKCDATFTVTADPL